MIGLLLFFAVFEIGLLLLGAGILIEAPKPLGNLDWVAVALVLLGSYLNSGPELQRW